MSTVVSVFSHRAVCARVCLFATLLALATGIVAFPRAGTAQQGQPPFEFAVIGDLGYDPDEEPLFSNVMADLDAVPTLAFVVHDGDLSTPALACEDEFVVGRLALFQDSTHPLIYTPGDNEWTDCWQARAGRVDPLER